LTASIRQRHCRFKSSRRPVIGTGVRGQHGGRCLDLLQPPPQALGLPDDVPGRHGRRSPGRQARSAQL